MDQMQSSLLTLPGLAEIDDAFNVFGLPFFFQTDEEAMHVRDKMTPLFEKRLEAKGEADRVGQRRLGAAVLEGADQDAGRSEEGQNLHERGRRQDGELVRTTGSIQWRSAQPTSRAR